MTTPLQQAKNQESRTICLFRVGYEEHCIYEDICEGFVVNENHYQVIEFDRSDWALPSSASLRSKRFRGVVEKTSRKRLLRSLYPPCRQRGRGSAIQIPRDPSRAAGRLFPPKVQQRFV